MTDPGGGKGRSGAGEGGRVVLLRYVPPDGHDGGGDGDGDGAGGPEPQRRTTNSAAQTSSSTAHPNHSQLFDPSATV